MSTNIRRVSAEALDVFQSYAVGDRVIISVDTWGVRQPEVVDRLALVAGYGFDGGKLQVKVQIVGYTDDEAPEMVWVNPLSTGTNLRKV